MVITWDTLGLTSASDGCSVRCLYTQCTCIMYFRGTKCVHSIVSFWHAAYRTKKWIVTRPIWPLDIMYKCFIICLTKFSKQSKSNVQFQCVFVFCKKVFFWDKHDTLKRWMILAKKNISKYHIIIVFKEQMCSYVLDRWQIMYTMWSHR